MNGTYARFGKPVEGYLETPYQYAKPYVNKADELGEKALETVDGHFPIVKEQPETIYESIKSWILWPVTYAKDAWTGMMLLLPALPAPPANNLHRRTHQDQESPTQPDSLLRAHRCPDLLRFPRHF